MNFSSERKSNNRFAIIKQNTDEISFRPRQKITKNKKYQKREENQQQCQDQLISAQKDEYNSFKFNKKHQQEQLLQQQQKQLELTINNNEVFPTLGASSKQSSKQSRMNYLAIAKREQKNEKKIDQNAVNPGWIKLWHNNGIIYSKYGLPTQWRLDEYKRDEEDFKKVAHEILTQWQSERDEITELLGDQSPYYNTPSLLDYLPEEDEDYYIKNNESD